MKKSNIRDLAKQPNPLCVLSNSAHSCPKSHAQNLRRTFYLLIIKPFSKLYERARVGEENILLAVQNQFYAAKPFILRRLQIYYLKTGKQKVNFSGFLVCKGVVRAQKYSFLRGRLFTRFLAETTSLWEPARG